MSEYCYNVNLVFILKKGIVVLWYNYMMDFNGWLGERDLYLIYGGCVVKEGIKWIVNNWIIVLYKNCVYVFS